MFSRVMDEGIIVCSFSGRLQCAAGLCFSAPMAIVPVGERLDYPTKGQGASCPDSGMLVV